MLLADSPWLQSLGVSLFINLFLGPVHGFFPTTWKETLVGSGGVSHQQQTEQVFQTLATKYFPTIEKLTDTMIKARDTICKANAAVDDDQDHSALHFDGENFEGGQARLTTLKQQVLELLGKDQAVEARTALGGALHTVQDFYSHTNWVEMGNNDISPDLGRDKPIAHALDGQTTCAACGPHNPLDTTDSDCPDCRNNEAGFNNLLTSGYFFNEDRPGKGVPIPANKCHHGKSVTSLQAVDPGVLKMRQGGS